MAARDGETKGRVLGLGRFRRERDGEGPEPVFLVELTRSELLVLAVALDELPESFGPVEELARKIDRLLGE